MRKLEKVEDNTEEEILPTENISNDVGGSFDEYGVGEKKFGSSIKMRQDTDFFDEDSYIPHELIGVKYVELPKKSGEDWEIVKDKITVLVVKGVRFSKKERIFLRTPNGMSFLINGYKRGWKTISEFKRQIKSFMKK